MAIGFPESRGYIHQEKLEPLPPLPPYPSGPCIYGDVTEHREKTEAYNKKEKEESDRKAKVSFKKSISLL